MFKNSESSSRIRFADVTFKESPARARFSHIFTYYQRFQRMFRSISSNTDNKLPSILELLCGSAQLLLSSCCHFNFSNSRKAKKIVKVCYILDSSKSLQNDFFTNLIDYQSHSMTSVLASEVGNFVRS